MVDWLCTHALQTQGQNIRKDQTKTSGYAYQAHIYHMIEDLLIQRADYLTKKEPIYRNFRAGDVLHSQADISRAQQLLHYQPSHKIAEGLDEAIDWYVNALGG
ncbi:MAG: hypothetical protein GXP08_00025 [Gammaproteobacteria bacterium]|nr:hypothetical protein [Gammaproteobacteria bacterium]